LTVPPLRILHVEDDPDDAFFLVRALKGALPECEIHLEKNGEGAIEYLRQAASKGELRPNPKPDLIILDLKLTGMSGFEVLSHIRQQEAHKLLPIIILSGSSLKEDQTKAGELGASEFVVKHSDYDEIARHVARFVAKMREGRRGDGLALNPPQE